MVLTIRPNAGAAVPAVSKTTEFCVPSAEPADVLPGDSATAVTRAPEPARLSRERVTYIVSPSARFGVPVARTLGNCPSMPSLNLFVNLMGAARVREMIFTARLIGAAEARDIGLVSEVVESEEALMPRAEAVTQQISSNAPLTLRAVKEGIRRILVQGQLDPSVGRDLLVECYMSEDFREGVEAFVEKRKPTCGR